MKNFLFNHLKNFGGWTTDKKILCFAVDDYGNVLLNSSKSLEVLKSKGLSSPSRFEQLDALDTKEDYEMLFELLSHKTIIIKMQFSQHTLCLQTLILKMF